MLSREGNIFPHFQTPFEEPPKVTLHSEYVHYFTYLLEFLSKPQNITFSHPYYTYRPNKFVLTYAS